MLEFLVVERIYGKDFFFYCLVLVRGFYRMMKRWYFLGIGGERVWFLLNVFMCFLFFFFVWGVDGVGFGWLNKSVVFYFCRWCFRSWYDFYLLFVIKGRWWGRYWWCWCWLCCWCWLLFFVSYVYIDIVRLKFC